MIEQSALRRLPAAEAVGLLGARRDLTPEEEDGLAAAWGRACQDLGESALVQGMARDGAAPLLARHFASPRLAGVAGPAAQAALQEELRHTRILNLRSLSLVLRLSATLAEIGVPLMPLKGIYLAHVLYGDLGLRPMDDLDLMCREEHLAPVLQALRAQGYASAPCQGSIQAWENADSAARLHVEPLHKPGHVSVEIHLHPFSLHNRDLALTEALWEASRPEAVGQAKIQAMDPVHHLAFQILHLHRHLFLPENDRPRWYWFADLHEGIRRLDPDALAGVAGGAPLGPERGDRHDARLSTPAGGRAGGQGTRNREIAGGAAPVQAARGDDARSNWEALSRFAGQWGLEKPVATVLEYLRRYWGTPVPAGLELLRAADPTPVEAPLQSESLRRRQGADYLHSRLAWVAEVRRTRGRLAAARYAFRFLFPRVEYMKSRYPSTSTAGLVKSYAAHGGALLARAARAALWRRKS